MERNRVSQGGYCWWSEGQIQRSDSPNEARRRDLQTMFVRETYNVCFARRTEGDQRGMMAVIMQGF